MSELISSLLQKVSSAQMDDLIFENELANQGYSFYYTIDNHDIIKYCFPGGFSGDNFEKNSFNDNTINYDLETDILTAYDEFYNSLEPDNPLLFLNEYIPELKDMKYQLEQRIARGKLLNYAEDFNGYFESTNPDSSKMILEDFTLYIAIATGFIQNGAQRFNAIVTNPNFIYRSDQFASLPKGQSILEVFLESYRPGFIRNDRIFSLFMKHSPRAHRFSKLTDTEAIERVGRMNEIISNQPGNKRLFLFLSTSEATTKVFRDFTEWLPRIHYRPFNFHRTVEQLFIKKLLQDLDYENKKERLEKCKALIAHREQNQIGNYGPTLVWEKNLIDNLKNLREKYVNTNLARKEQFEKIKSLDESLKKISTTMNLTKLKQLFQNLKNLSDKYADEHENITDIKIVEAKFQMDQTFISVFRKAISNLEAGYPFKISRGQDMIEGTGHHLPVVFFHEKNTENFLDKIAELYLDQFAFLNKAYPPDSLTGQIKDIAASIYDTEFNIASLYDKLVLCLYMLILPDITQQGYKTNNYIVEDFLREIREYISSDINQTLFADYMYIYCWVLRRNANYNEALKESEKMINEFPDDPRFFHSRFLINVCMQARGKDEKKLFDAYNSFLSDIKTAQSKYVEPLTQKSHTIAMNTKATLLNSEIYAEVLLTQLDILPAIEKQAIINEIEVTKLPYLKSIVGRDYEDFPEFLHTEATFNWAEGNLMEENDLKKQKIEEAITKLDLAIKHGSRLINYDIKPYYEMMEKLRKSAAEIQ